MLLDKMSDGFESINTRLQNEVRTWLRFRVMRLDNNINKGNYGNDQTRKHNTINLKTNDYFMYPATETST